MLFLALYEIFAALSHNEITKRNFIRWLCDLAVYVFEVLTIFFAPAWWYIFIAIGIKLISLPITLIIEYIFGSPKTRFFMILTLFIICPVFIILMYLDLFGII